MRAFIFVAAAVFCAASASAQLLAAEPQYAPIPYQFAYKADSDEGSHSQEETSDANGRRQGSYTISLADGRQRTVTYVADENGFRAEVSTNELGTESKDTGDVRYSSSAITGEQAAIQYGAQPQRQVRVAAPVTVVRTAPSPIIKYTAPAPTIIKTVSAPRVVKTVTAAAAPVYSYSAAPPTVVKTIQSAPVSYAVSHTAPITYTTAHHAAPLIQVQHDGHDVHVVHHKRA